MLLSLAVGWGITQPERQCLGQRTHLRMLCPPALSAETWKEMNGQESQVVGSQKADQGGSDSADRDSSFHCQDVPLCGQEQRAGSGRFEEMTSALNIVKGSTLIWRSRGHLQIPAALSVRLS